MGTRGVLRLLAALLLAAGSAASALAHGGSYRGPGSGGGPGGPPPGPADDQGPVTAWETWWANNKYLHLQLGEGMRENAGPTTPDGGGGGEGPADPAEVRAAQDALVREAVVPMFIEALSDPSFEVRTAAAVALGKSGDPSGAEPLRRAADKDEHQDVRDSALLGLGLLGQKRAVPWLAEVLRDEKATTRHRSFAAFSLGLIGGEDAAKSLVDYMRVGDGLRHRGDAPLLASCLLAMGFTAEKSVLPTLRDASDDRAFDDQTRAFAWLALGRAADRESIPMMVAALDGPRSAPVPLQRAAAVALGRLVRVQDMSAVTTLVQTVHANKDPLVRHFAAISLGTLRDPAIDGQMRKLFETSDASDRAFAALALGVAGDAAAAPMIRRELAAERVESQRGAYSIALGMLQDKASRAVLEAQVKDQGSIWAQGYAALAIGMARIHDAAPVLRAELERTNDPRLRANLAVGLGLLRDPVARKWFFATLQGNGTIYERGGAAMALGLLRINEAVPVLIGVWRDKGEQDLVRAYAMVSLGVLCDPSDPPKLAQFSIDQDYSIRNDPLNEVMSIY